MKGRRIFLLLSVLLFAISVSAEPLVHDHHDEDHHEEFCVVCHFVEISSIRSFQSFRDFRYPLQELIKRRVLFLFFILFISLLN